MCMCHSCRFMALRFCCSCSVTVVFWNLSGLGHTLNCWSFLKIWYHGGRMKGRYSSLTHCALVYYWLWPWYCHKCRTPRRRSQCKCANAFLRYQGRCLDGKRLVDLGPELELVGLVMSPGSWLGMCSKTAVWRFQGAMHCTRCSSTEWLTMTLPRPLSRRGAKLTIYCPVESVDSSWTEKSSGVPFSSTSEGEPG